MLDGSVFAVRAKNLFETRGIRKLYVYLGTEIIPVVQEKQMYSLEIDVPGDFSLIQYYMEKINKEKVNKLPHFILEVANNHAGDINVIKNLILQFSELDYPDLGIKFQAFKYDTIALPDYRWYESYKEFFICKEAWKEIIELAHRKIGKVWLDIFCVYGLEVFKENKDSIWGIKLQASVLRNAELLSFLENIELSDKELIVNLSGYELSEINEFISELNDLNFKKIILQIGFQHYPTTIRDTSLRKIDIIKASFPGLNISFADHLAAEDEFSKKFPVYAYLKGCNYIEKHVCHSRKRSKYDYFSALEFDEVKKIIVELKKVNECFSAKFIPKNEMVYLETTFQKPVLKRDLDAGQLIADADLVYRRTDREGMDSKDLYALQSEFYIINRKLEENHTLIRSDFKRAKMAVIVAARMKSTRLKKKAVLPICGSASVERCLESCLKFSFVDDVILATSFLKNDEILKKHTLGGKVKFWQGDPSDVISRFIGACEAYGVDVVIRVTADCPVVSPEIAKILLRAHFKNGADFTEAKHLAVGTNSDIYNVEALKRVIRYIGKGKDTAYMGWFMRNNPELFKINVVDLPADLVRDYRLTLDYKEDLDMFNALYRKLEEKGLDVDLPNIFAVLDENPEIPVMNSHLAQVYEVDQELIHRLNKETKIAANV